MGIALLGWSLVLFNPPPAARPDICVCAQTKQNDGWCGLCKVGHVAGVALKSYPLFEAIDAHGHDFDPARILCPSCQKAIETDGYCDSCKMGFVRKQAYLSRLSYLLARGTRTDPEKLTCETCRKSVVSPAWCFTCRRGLVGNVVIGNEDEFRRTIRELERLRASIAMLERCESCAVALFCNGSCMTCRRSYRDGVATDGIKP